MENLKSRGMLNKTLASNFNAVESNNPLMFDKKIIAMQNIDISRAAGRDSLSENF